MVRMQLVVQALLRAACPPAGVDLAALPNNTQFQAAASEWSNYMQGSCMAQRREAAVHVMQARGCRRIADIGALHLRLIDSPGYGGPDLYANIDPSAAEARVERSHDHCNVDLPLTIQQFHADWHFDCVVLLGAMRLHFADGAMERVLRSAHTLVMEEAMTMNPESPAGNCSTFREAMPMLGELGFRNAAVAPEADLQSGVSPLCGPALEHGLTLDCRGDIHGETGWQGWEDIFMRQLAVFERDPALTRSRGALSPR